MKTIFKPAIWKILKLFYENKNKPIHLREISRLVKLNESTISRHLNNLVKMDVLKTLTDGNLKKFYVNKIHIPDLFPLFDSEKLEALPILRRDAVKLYLSKIEKKPVFLIVFGSTAKGNFNKQSDLDLLEIISTKYNNEKVKMYVEAQTGIKLQIFRIRETQFYKELKLKNDRVVQAALETGFPVFNGKYFYEEVFL